MARVPPQQHENAVILDSPHSSDASEAETHEAVNVIQFQLRESCTCLLAELALLNSVVELPVSH